MKSAFPTYYNLALVERHGPEVHRRLRGEAKTCRILERFELCDFIADQVLEEVAQLASSRAFSQ